MLCVFLLVTDWIIRNEGETILSLYYECKQQILTER